MTRFMLNDESLGKIYDYDNDFYQVRTVKCTQKVHHCVFCDKDIDLGSSCNKHVGVGGSQFFWYYAHKSCE
jgi:hypothetical protein